jgi:hypothetical protein
MPESVLRRDLPRKGLGQNLSLVHDVAVVDDDGHVVARGRVANDAAGFAALLTLLAEDGIAPRIRSR